AASSSRQSAVVPISEATKSLRMSKLGVGGVVAGAVWTDMTIAFGRPTVTGSGSAGIGAVWTDRTIAFGRRTVTGSGSGSGSIAGGWLATPGAGGGPASAGAAAAVDAGCAQCSRCLSMPGRRAYQQRRPSTSRQDHHSGAPAGFAVRHSIAAAGVVSASSIIVVTSFMTSATFRDGVFAYGPGTL